MDTEISMNSKKDVYMEKDVDITKNFAESNLYKNCLSLVHLCKRKPKMVEEIKKYLSENHNNEIADNFSNLTSINLISLMDDKEIISIRNFDDLVRIFGEISHDLKKELSRICKYFFSCYSIKSYPC